MPKPEKEKITKKVVKTKKVEPVPIKEEPAPPVEPEPKKKVIRRKKEPPTKEEVLKLLTDGAVEVKQIIQDLKEDQSKFSLITMEKVPDLVAETIKNLEEDLEELEQKQQELEAAQPEE